MGDKIVTFSDRFGARTLHEHALRNPSFIGDLTPPLPGVCLDVKIEAFVNGGRWIAMCPTDGCDGCEYVNDVELLFFCCECRNAQWDHRPIRVVMPDAKTRGQVEAYLGARPSWRARNWAGSEEIAARLGERPQTVRDLRAENRKHGLRIDER